METDKASLLHYVVDARASRFTVQVFASGMLSAMGHDPTMGIRTFRGEVDFSAESAEGRGFHLTVQSNSLNVLDDLKDKDRREIERMMNDQVLEVSKYPEIVYEVAVVSVVRLEAALYSASLNGNLTLHGVTRSQPISARIAVFDEMVRASGEFAMRQTDFDIKPISVAGGALKVKDEIRFSFEMVARKLS